MGKIRDDFNEYGTAITVFICNSCRREFAVCPAVSDDRLSVSDDRLSEWDDCLADDCESYDANRDVDALLFFGIVTIEESGDA